MMAVVSFYMTMTLIHIAQFVIELSGDEYENDANHMQISASQP